MKKPLFIKTLEREKRQVRRTHQLIRFLRGTRFWKTEPFRAVAEWTEFHEKDPYGHSVICPASLSMKPALFLLPNLYFSEDFPALEKSLSAISHLDRFNPICDERTNEVFVRWQTRSCLGTWHRVGRVDAIKLLPGCRWISTFDMVLIQLSSSCVVLSISVFPTKEFTQEFQRLANEKIKSTTKIQRILVSPRRWVFSSSIPDHTRRCRNEALITEILSEVSVALKALPKNQSVHDHIPAVAVYTYEEISSVNEGELQAFWKSLDLQKIPELSYANTKGATILPPENHYWSKLPPRYRVLIDRQRYAGEDDIKIYASRDNAINSHLENEFILPLIPLLALSDYVDSILRQIAILRRKLSPVVARNRGLFSFARIMIQLFHAPLRINALHFQIARIADPKNRIILDEPCDCNFRRKVASGDADGHLSTDIQKTILREIISAQQEISTLRQAYQDLWNFCIQWILLILTILGVIIAAAQF